MIIICTRCKGTGHVYFDVGTHNSEYEYEICGKCKGSGRMIEEVNTTYKVFIQNIDDVNQATRI